MRIYQSLFEAVKEVERDLWEMGVDVDVQSMQDKKGEFKTKEVQGYGFKIVDYRINEAEINKVIKHLFPPGQWANVVNYIQAEFADRVSGKQMNPGNSYKYRKEVWDEYLHDGKFSYTYTERMAIQLPFILKELQDKPGTRQGIVNIHTNISPEKDYRVWAGTDLYNMGGKGRIPCSMYYQIMRRAGKVDLIYTMRSCDFLTHFGVDVCLAMLLQAWFAQKLGEEVGTFTYFTGSLHAYYDHMKERGIF